MDFTFSTSKLVYKTGGPDAPEIPAAIYGQRYLLDSQAAFDASQNWQSLSDALKSGYLGQVLGGFRQQPFSVGTGLVSGATSVAGLTIVAIPANSPSLTPAQQFPFSVRQLAGRITRVASTNYPLVINRSALVDVSGNFTVNQEVVSNAPVKFPGATIPLFTTVNPDGSEQKISSISIEGGPGGSVAFSASRLLGGQPVRVTNATFYPQIIPDALSAAEFTALSNAGGYVIDLNWVISIDIEDGEFPSNDGTSWTSPDLLYFLIVPMSLMHGSTGVLDSATPLIDGSGNVYGFEPVTPVDNLASDVYLAFPLYKDINFSSGLSRGGMNAAGYMANVGCSFSGVLTAGATPL